LSRQKRELEKEPVNTNQSEDQPMNDPTIETFAGLIPENVAPIIQVSAPLAISLLVVVTVIRVIKALAPALIMATVLAVWIVAVQGPEGLEELSATVKGAFGSSANSAALIENLRPWLEVLFS
jgi:hypothetical protein